MNTLSDALNQWFSTYLAWCTLFAISQYVIPPFSKIVQLKRCIPNNVHILLNIFILFPINTYTFTWIIFVEEQKLVDKNPARPLSCSDRCTLWVVPPKGVQKLTFWVYQSVVPIPPPWNPTHPRWSSSLVGKHFSKPIFERTKIKRHSVKF